MPPTASSAIEIDDISVPTAIEISIVLNPSAFIVFHPLRGKESGVEFCRRPDSIARGPTFIVTPAVKMRLDVTAETSQK
jgi:hypothetical protein